MEFMDEETSNMESVDEETSNMESVIIEEANKESINEETSNTTIKNNRKRAPVRQYLELSPNGKNVCKLCKQEFSNQTAITTIKRHFKNFHLMQYNQIHQHQLELQRHNPYNSNDKLKVDTLNEKFLKWIIIDQQAFLLVENVYFLDFIQELDPRYKLPCRQTLSAWVNKEYIIKKSELKKLLDTIPSKVSITTDVWTSCTQQPFLSITIHWIDTMWKMHRILLDIIPFNNNHTTENQSNEIIKTLREMNLGKKLLGFTTDNASNMVATGRILRTKLFEEFENSDVDHFRCAAHILNLGVEEGIKLVNTEIRKA